ncbi:MAG TPA: serine/threonine-protein kinase [Sandaracinaceae bacterium LLY-WYZ-13_1]|nr:serine/threonine-protein kinase [Sandaracinaceae bacterium LLY-WYZ-13_1]
MLTTRRGVGTESSKGATDAEASSSGVQRMLHATQRGLGKVLGSSPAPKITGSDPGAKKALDSVKVVMATGLYKTAAGVVGQRLFKEHAEALRAYLTVQLRSVGAARRTLTAIEEDIEHGSAEQLEKGPSRRAAIFLAARNAVEWERLFGDGEPAPLHAVPWEPTPPGRVEGWGRALDEIRFGLGPDEGELLMLRHACGLSEADLAYVLGAGRTEVSRRLEAGAGFARLLLEDVFGDEGPPLEAVLEDAYRVEPPTPEELAAAAKPKVVPLPAGTVIGDRYEIEEAIGGGEFAYVYRARDVRVPGHVVALKLLHRVARTQAAREGAMRELSLIASAFHPSLVQFKDHGWYEDRLWFVMPFYEGSLLLDRLGEGTLPLEDALEWFERLARGLAALHAAGIRHQDIKPENIFLVELRTGARVESPEVLPVLLDLGVASPSGEMALAGTPMYFPPEVAGRLFDEHCELPLTPKADVFALALSLLHSIEAPDFSDLETMDVDEFLKKRARVVPKGPTDGALAALRPRFDRWLAHHPEDRPSAGELADEIAEVRAERGPRARRAAPRGLRTAVFAGAAASLLAVAAMSTDTPVRPVRVAPGGAAPAHAANAEPSERERLLQHRLETEARRAMALEDELGRLRRRALGLEEGDDEDASRAEAPEAPADGDDPVDPS